MRQQSKKAVSLAAPSASDTDSALHSEWQRHAAFNFTGCLAHADITHTKGQQTVTHIIGWFEHNAACTAAILVFCPPVPLHEHVYEVALRQLRQGARYVIQSLCLKHHLILSDTALTIYKT